MVMKSDGCESKTCGLVSFVATALGEGSEYWLSLAKLSMAVESDGNSFFMCVRVSDAGPEVMRTFQAIACCNSSSSRSLIITSVRVVRKQRSKRHESKRSDPAE